MFVDPDLGHESTKNTLIILKSCDFGQFKGTKSKI